ncbi:hypothetical protein SAMN05660642_02471 [Geodermatophilus siccatus]|uniref:Uncharacterized protein n=1 Tax=Geodermatophilus siccatus TaxID=1137991 RepID=A0A1G9T326_9ACTN|nr:hypothetical protein [Geodermatophilus siccatus]SDM42036.1 hypothetical protein SAMN05660642_02471 [Geodermatophilus siccatus]
MLGDQLAQWLAVQRSGRINRLRRTHDWLARTDNITAWPADSGRWLRDMAALGNLEVDWDTDRWSTTPLVLTRIPEGDGLALLVGCRSSSCDRTLDDLWLEVHRLPQVLHPSGLARPTVVLLQYDSPEDLPMAAKALGATYVPCAAEQLTTHLSYPQLGEPAAGPNLQNASLEQFDPRTQEWRPTTVRPLPQGAYRYEWAGRKRYLYLGPEGWRQCDMPAAVFAALATVKVSPLRWRADSSGRDVGCLYVDWGVPLPVLHQRCLVLCSGFTPRFSDRARTGIYDNIPRSIAEAVATSLGQTLEVS